MRLREIHRRLGISAGHPRVRLTRRYDESLELVEVGPDVFGRPQRMAPEAAASWRSMVSAAAADGVELQLVSAFRSVERQAELIAAKVEGGRDLEEVLTANAPPGHSEHHTGCAVDVTTPGCAVLEEEFEDTEAFRWLAAHAGRFGFALSYPRGNPEGYVYEPWHWSYRPPQAPRRPGAREAT
ncbi:MAG TPA: M15 family metallopeptidase [Thermoanaerobaculia bacterium]|nr:M15 family metallopeptidase [Thermoanaerobaculia bacterium]